MLDMSFERPYTSYHSLDAEEFIEKFAEFVVLFKRRDLRILAKSRVSGGH